LADYPKEDTVKMTKKDKQNKTKITPEPSDDSSFQPSVEENTAEGWENYVPEFVKRSIHFGRGREDDRGKAWFLPREIAKEIANLPKEIAVEIARSTLEQADRIKNETLKIIAVEVRNFLNNAEIWKEIRNIMDDLTLDIEMKIKFHQKPPPSPPPPTEKNEEEKEKNKEDEKEEEKEEKKEKEEEKEN